MKLGTWFQNELKVPLLHHAGFHQRRPQDYPRAYLNSTAFPAPISFHNIFSQSKDGSLAREVLQNVL